MSLDGHDKLCGYQKAICSLCVSTVHKTRTVAGYILKMLESLRSHAKDYRLGLWAMASIGHERFFFKEIPYGTARPRKNYFRFISHFIKSILLYFLYFSF